MKKKARLFCIAAAFLITVPMLSGCSSTQKQTPEIQELSAAGSASTENAADGQSSAPETASVTEVTDTEDQAEPDQENRKALAEARDTLTRYLDAMQRGDCDTVAELSDFLLYVEYIGTPETDPEETLREAVADAAESLDSFQISNGFMNPDALKKYNDNAAEMTAEAQKYLDDPNESEKRKREAEIFQKMLFPADNICCFQVKTVWDGKDEKTQNMYLLHTDGKWKISIYCSDILVSPVAEPDVRTDAKNAYIAMNTALTDLDFSNLNVDAISETLTYHGSDFADLQPTELNQNGSTSASELLALLPYLVWCYFNEIEKADTVVFAIDHGTCQAVAWKLENGNYNVYPQESRGAQKEYSSAEEALDSAKAYQP